MNGPNAATSIAPPLIRHRLPPGPSREISASSPDSELKLREKYDKNCREGNWWNRGRTITVRKGHGDEKK